MRVREAQRSARRLAVYASVAVGIALGMASRAHTTPAAGDAQVRVTPYRDGPYLLRGPFELVDQDGTVIETGRRTVALCRCGRSQTRPFCDGTHKLVGFVAPSGPEERRS